MNVALDNQILELYNTRNVLSTDFRVAIYVRLSKEDMRKGEDPSESIKNQYELLKQFAEQNGFNVVDWYQDDDYTGQNYERPGFNRLLADMESGRINMVITKDLSRLGRDYIETGHYLEKYFPLKNIRYIAVTDHVDTFADSLDNEMTPFKLIFNDLYSKDISKKVRATFNSKRNKGEYIGGFPPYGYKLDPYKKGHFIVDEPAAEIVKRVFDLYLKGDTYVAIAEKLDKDGVPTRAQYKQQTSKYKASRRFTGRWCGEAVRQILTEQTYTGCVVQNKSNKINYKVDKFRLIPKTDWIVVPDQHEPIIESDVFDTVQQLIGKNNTKCGVRNTYQHVLSGLVYCGECGAKMTFDRNRQGDVFTSVCIAYKKKNCTSPTRVYVHEEELENFVFEQLKNLFKNKVNKNDLLDAANTKKITVELEGITKQINSYEKELLSIQNAIRTLYKDKLKGIVTERDYVALTEDFQKERETLERKLQALEERKENLIKYQNDSKEVLKAIDEFLETEILTKPIIHKLVARIEVFNDQSIKIYVNFKCN